MANEKAVKRKRDRAQAENAENRRRRRHGRRALHYMALLLFLLTIGTILSLTVFFKIEAVNVLGADRYTPAEIAAASGVQLEDNLLRINKTEISENVLRQFPYVKFVQVHRLPWPPTVEITVQPAVPAGAILQDEEIVLIDQEGKVLERGMLMIPDGVILIKGIDTSGFLPGDYLGVYTPPAFEKDEEIPPEESEKQQQAKETYERLVTLEYLRAAIKESGFAGITNVDITDRLNMRVRYEDRLQIELGSESQLTYKLELVQAALEQLEADAEGTLYATEIARKWVRYDPVVNRGASQSIPGDEEEEKDEQKKTDSVQILVPREGSADSEEQEGELAENEG